MTIDVRLACNRELHSSRSLLACAVSQRTAIRPASTLRLPDYDSGADSSSAAGAAVSLSSVAAPSLAGSLRRAAFFARFISRRSFISCSRIRFANVCGLFAIHPLR